jgi:hypothetical protein
VGLAAEIAEANSIPLWLARLEPIAAYAGLVLWLVVCVAYPLAAVAWTLWLIFG